MRLATSQLIPLITVAVLLTSAGFDVIRHQSTTPVKTLTITEKEILPPVDARLTDFEPIEESLAHLEFDNNGALVMGPATETALRNAASPFMDKEIPPASLQRIQFLIKQSLASPAAQQFGELLPVFVNYLQKEKDLISAIQQADTLDQEITIHEQLVTLRHNSFGQSLTDDFYRSEHLLAHYQYTIRKIRNDNALSEAEKTEHLKEAEKTFRKAIAE